MNSEMEIYRKEIDEIDENMVRLFKQRMGVAAKIGEYKAAHGLPVLDPARERTKLAQIVAMADDASTTSGAAQAPSMATHLEALYSLIFELSRSYQRKLSGVESPLKEKILAAIEGTERLFPPRALVACQGMEGAYSQMACEKIFSGPNIMYFNSFESVFAAIDKGLCAYGVLPLENSTAGSVNEIYDLMMAYDFNIVRSTRLKVDHCLLAPRGTKKSEIKEIFSHDQAFAQCSDFLKSLGDVKITPCENTAMAARLVMESAHNESATGVAAIASLSCAELYGLECLETSVQNQGNNYTRFICISKNLEIYPGADKTSIMMVLPHRPGALYKTLSKFYALGINLMKLESRPLPNSDFEFMFYFDLETSVYSPEFLQIFSDLEETCSMIKYLGSYSEVV